jgi:hypothetical protein
MQPQHISLKTPKTDQTNLKLKAKRRARNMSKWNRTSRKINKKISKRRITKIKPNTI